jgi:hypothetical protein
MKFDILINELFININNDPSLSPIDNKNVLSLINDYEDGLWRFNKFQQFIWDNIAETALSYRERESLIGFSSTMLAESAKKLRLTDKKKDISKGSELAEIVLYAIMKHHYNALPVVPKIYYKQNPSDNAKGADSVHIIIHANSDFSLWFGEAKFYNSLEDTRLYEIIKSIKNSLNTEKLKKENSIITDLQDVDGLIKNPTLLKQIKEALSTQNSIDNLKPKINIPILLLHECEITKRHKNLSPEYKKEIIDYQHERAVSYFKKQISILGSTISQYSDIKFHIILFPVPDKKVIVDKFLANVKFHKNQ